MQGCRNCPMTSMEFRRTRLVFDVRRIHPPVDVTAFASISGLNSLQRLPFVNVVGMRPFARDLRIQPRIAHTRGPLASEIKS
jgi:hypothetical protein